MYAYKVPPCALKAKFPLPLDTKKKGEIKNEKEQELHSTFYMST